MTAHEPTDDKFITFHRNDLVFDGEYVTFKTDDEVHDAVVIRRQDKFASAALAGYAASIAIVIGLTTDPTVKAELLIVADYFQRMSEMAGESDIQTKLPDV